MRRMCRVVCYLILFTACGDRLCDTSTTDQPTTDGGLNFTTTTWTDPKMPFLFTIVVLESRNTTAFSALQKVLPAVDMATLHVNQVYAGILQFDVVYGEGSCDRDIVGVSAARISCSRNISAFIGPACSKAVETIAYMANDWNLPVITPIANTENVGDKKLFPRLTRINSVMQSSFVSTIFYLMKVYRWRHAVFFYDKDSITGSLLGDTFTKAFKETNYIWNSYDLSSKQQDQSSFRRPLMDAASRARVFILFMETKVLRSVLLEAYSLGYTRSSEFVFIIIQGMSTAPTDATTWKLGNQTDSAIQESLAQALFMHIDDSSLTLPPEFIREVKQRADRDYNFDFATIQVPTWLARYYDAVTIYATVVNDTITGGEDPYDGLAVTKRIWNRTFTGLSGKVTINAEGDRTNDVTITALNPASQQLQKYAVFHSETRTMTFYSSKAFPWPLNSGGPPGDEPDCGFTGIQCANEENSIVIACLSGFFAVAAVVGGSVTLIMFRRWKKNSDKDMWWWKVDAADLSITDKKFVHSILSFTSKTSMHGSAFDTESVGAKNGLLAVFKGQTVRLRSLPMKQPKFTRDMLTEFKLVRDLNHNNLVRIFGACFEDQIKALLLEHCNKGSLQDLLGNTNVSLDAQFKFSLCTDIVNGISYLHESPAKCHGRLNSEVCLVDNRFSVKLADYALPSVYAQLLDDVGSQEYKTTCLWKAPEVLRGSDKKGSREADIYSFGVILCEVITRDCPYSSEILYLTTEEILEKVQQVSSPPFRPSVEVPVRLTGMRMLMEKCWAENPKERPSAQTVRTAIKKIALSLGETGNLLDNMMRRMELYANNLEKLVEDKTVELREEKKKPVADRLKAGLRMEPESYECVTIYFSDIVGFTTISANSSPIQVVDLLNDVYSCFDAIADQFDVYKVETIGDAYMVVSGLPQRNGNMHAAHIARMSLQLVNEISAFKIRHMPDERLRLRVGLHSGPVCAGVVGLKMPRYCLFGDTVNTASRMESHGQAMMIHMSSDVKAILDTFGSFEITSRGEILIKGKGQMTTYWLKKETTPVPKS